MAFWITPAQIEYIESLCAELGYSTRFALSEGLDISDPVNGVKGLTRKEASELIDWLKEEKRGG